VCGAQVATASDADIRIDGFYSQLIAIHTAPEFLWPALVKAMTEGEWTAEQTRKRIAATT
jgi:hypothetical protein